MFKCHVPGLLVTKWLTLSFYKTFSRISSLVEGMLSIHHKHHQDSLLNCLLATTTSFFKLILQLNRGFIMWLSKGFSVVMSESKLLRDCLHISSTLQNIWWNLHWLQTLKTKSLQFLDQAEESCLKLPSGESPVMWMISRGICRSIFIS